MYACPYCGRCPCCGTVRWPHYVPPVVIHAPVVPVIDLSGAQRAIRALAGKVA